MSDKNKVLMIKIVSILVAIVLVIGFIIYKIESSKKIKDIIIYQEYVKLALGDTYRVNFETVPKSAKNDKLVWQTDNEDIITLDNGLVIANKVGSANIWISPKNDPTIKKGLKVSIATKKQRFKEGLEAKFSYKEKEENLLEANDRYFVNLNEHTFTILEGTNNYTYYYLEKKIIVVPTMNNFNANITYNVESGESTCSSNDPNWCGKEQAHAIEKAGSFASLFNTYLGGYSASDIA